MSAAAKTFTTRDAHIQREPGPRFEEAESELHWYFTVAESVLGLRGGGLEPSGGQAVWDSARIHDAHMKPRLTRHRADMAKVARIKPTVERLSRESSFKAMIVLQPRRWSLVRPNEQTDEATEHSASPDPLASITRRPKGLGCLAGLCMLTPAANLAWTARERALKHPERDPSPLDLLTFLRDEATSLNARKTFKPMVEQASRLFDVALAEYETHRLERVAVERVRHQEIVQARDASLARLRAGEGP